MKVKNCVNSPMNKYGMAIYIYFLTENILKYVLLKRDYIFLFKINIVRFKINNFFIYKLIKL